MRARWAVASAEGVLVAMPRPASCWIGRLWLEPIDEVQIEAAQSRKEEKDEGVACGSVAAEEEEEEVKERVLSSAAEEEGDFVPTQRVFQQGSMRTSATPSSTFHFSGVTKLGHPSIFFI